MFDTTTMRYRLFWFSVHRSNSLRSHVPPHRERSLSYLCSPITARNTCS